MTRRIYMDNAATSFPKPPAVLEAMTRYATELGASPGRGAYAEAREAGRLMYQCRERINTLINGQSPDHVVFTLNTTDALNLAIRGIIWAPRSSEAAGLKPRSLVSGGRRHLITTHLDHNSVLRPFNALCQHDHIAQTRVPCDPLTGLADPEDIRKAITPDTCLVAVVHGSNVTGTLQPIAEIGAICREHDIPFLVDAAQSLGHVPVDVQAMNIDLLAAPGHKGLLGPLGTGFLYIRPGIEQRMVTIREGGTGSVSEQDTQPDFMPDRFEPGSHNAIGIIGLSEGVQWIIDHGIHNLWQHDQKLTAAFLDGIREIEGLTLFGPPTASPASRCGVFSVRAEGYEQPVTLSDRLEQDFGILTRSGIHCAPLAHQTIGTHHLAGTTRLSFGPFLTADDVRYATDALSKICQDTAVTSA